MRRRYSDFEWLRSELERDSKVMHRVNRPRPAQTRSGVPLGYRAVELECLCRPLGLRWYEHARASPFPGTARKTSFGTVFREMRHEGHRGSKHLFLASVAV